MATKLAQLEASQPALWQSFRTFLHGPEEEEEDEDEEAGWTCDGMAMDFSCVGR